MSFEKEIQKLYAWAAKEIAKHPHSKGRLIIPKSHIKRGKMKATQMLDLRDYKRFIDAYGLTYEEAMLWRIADSPEFKYAYYECGIVPKVTMLENDGTWDPNQIKARITFEL
jgi:hypothetical protein